MKYFLIIGNLNAVTYADVMPSIKRGEVWLGDGKNLDFILPDGGVEKFGNIRWFTNIGVNNKKPFELTAKYSPEVYKKFDNYDAINVGRVKNIPLDFDGVMGVPVTFLDKHCPEQFEIIDAREVGLNERQRNKNTYLIKDVDGTINGKPTYVRICIKKMR